MTRRVAILYTEPAGYTLACLNALKSLYGVEILLICYSPEGNAPFEFQNIDRLDHVYFRSGLSTEKIIEILRDFSPEGIIVAGWIDGGYLAAARYFKKTGIPVIAGLDGQWRGTLRQRAATIASSLYLHSAFDVLWVTGERQADFAKRLGFGGEKIWYGFYCCDWNAFAAQYQDREKEKAFLFVGRYIAEKGLDVLIKAYSGYRRRTGAPWRLLCAGKGPQEKLLTAQTGVVNLGFIQPDKLPEYMGRVSAFVLPSRVEPWGVVIQEAASTGLPVICSDSCGAGVHLVQDCHSGFIFETGNARQLEECLVRMAGMSEDERCAMRRASFDLSKQYKPKRWARTLVSNITSIAAK